MPLHLLLLALLLVLAPLESSAGRFDIVPLSVPQEGLPKLVLHDYDLQAGEPSPLNPANAPGTVIRYVPEAQLENGDTLTFELAGARFRDAAYFLVAHEGDPDFSGDGDAHGAELHVLARSIAYTPGSARIDFEIENRALGLGADTTLYLFSSAARADSGQDEMIAAGSAEMPILRFSEVDGTQDPDVTIAVTSASDTAALAAPRLVLDVRPQFFVRFHGDILDFSTSVDSSSGWTRFLTDPDDELPIGDENSSVKRLAIARVTLDDPLPLDPASRLRFVLESSTDLRGVVCGVSGGDEGTFLELFRGAGGDDRFVAPFGNCTGNQAFLVLPGDTIDDVLDRTLDAQLVIGIDGTTPIVSREFSLSLTMDFGDPELGESVLLDRARAHRWIGLNLSAQHFHSGVIRVGRDDELACTATNLSPQVVDATARLRAPDGSVLEESTCCGLGSGGQCGVSVEGGAAAPLAGYCEVQSIAALPGVGGAARRQDRLGNTQVSSPLSTDDEFAPPGLAGCANACRPIYQLNVQTCIQTCGFATEGGENFFMACLQAVCPSTMEAILLEKPQQLCAPCLLDRRSGESIDQRMYRCTDRWVPADANRCILPPAPPTCGSAADAN